MAGQQQICADFAALVNGLRGLKHEVAGHKRSVTDEGTAAMLNVHQMALQSLETLARELWIELGPRLVAESVPEMLLGRVGPVRSCDGKMAAANDDTFE